MGRDASRQPRFLLLGGTGQVGYELRRSLAGLGDVITLGRDRADLSVPDSLRPAIREARPDVVVNAAAYTAVDRAESEAETARLVNTVAPGIIAEEAESLGACMVHYSTDYVFDGAKPGSYMESDPPAPLSVYGRTKAGGEQAVVVACQRHLVFRTSWVFSTRPPNFLLTILRLASERDTLRVVADQYGTPTAASLIADTTAAVLSMQLAGVDEDRWGLYHLTASGTTTWYDFACRIIERALKLGIPLRAAPGQVTPIATSDYPTAAMRPANSRLDTSKLRDAFGIAPSSWDYWVDRTLDQINLDRNR